MLYYETFSVYPLMHFNQIHTTVALLPPDLARRILRTADIEEQSRRAGAYILLEKMLRKRASDLVPSVKDLVKPEYTNFFEKRGALEAVRYDSYGKPYFEGLENATFNLSHSGYMVACALNTTPSGEIAAQVGIDIERVRIDRIRADRVAERYFNSAEKALLDAVSEDDEAFCRLFTRIWTKKEAILKYLGVGLTKISIADSTKPEEHGCFFLEGEQIHAYTDFVDGKPKEELYYVTVCTKIGETVYKETENAETTPENGENPGETPAENA